MVCATRLIPVLFFTNLALSKPIDNSNFASLDALPHKYGYMRYMGLDANVNSKIKHCLFLNDKNIIAIEKCPDVELELTQYVYGWVEVSSTETHLEKVAVVRTALKSGGNGDDLEILAVGAPSPKGAKTNKATLQKINGYPDNRPYADNQVKLDTAKRRISIPATNQCLLAKNGERSASDGMRGDKWFGNETLIWTDCNAVKADMRASFLFTQHLIEKSV